MLDATLTWEHQIGHVHEVVADFSGFFGYV